MSERKSRLRFLKKIAASGRAGLSIDHLSKEQRHLFDETLADGLVFLRETGAICLNQEGRNYLRRIKTTDGDPYRNQHLDKVMMEDKHHEMRFINRSESPLARLYFRKAKDGKRFVDEAEFLAGERLRADFERAGLTAKTGATLGPRVDCSRKNDGMMNTLDTAIEARQRVNAALRDVGEELGSLLLDVCCFLKGLEWVERERQWPVRSAKVVLKIGLRELARHYGLSDEARGRSR